MKRIILVRHATAVAKDPDKDDFYRALRKKGRKEARAMVAWYRSVAEVPDLLLSSPANRATETAQLFAKALGYPKKKIAQDEAIYRGIEPNELLAVLKTLDDKHESVMVFGHDPLFSEFAHFIAKGFKDCLPKCSIFGVKTNRRMWSTIRRGDGQLDIYEHPEGLRQRQALLEAIRREMADRMAEGILGVLGEFGIIGDEDERSKIQRAGTKLAKSFAPRASMEKPTAAVKRAAKKARSTKQSK